MKGKILQVVLALVLIIIGFTGCAKTQEETPVTPPTHPSTTTPSSTDTPNAPEEEEQEWITWECEHCGQRMSYLADHPPGVCSNCGESDWKIIDRVTISKLDTDNDWISDKVETEIGTDPLKLDTDGDGIDDFNETYVYPYLLDPLNPSDAKEFLAMIPNVKAEGCSPFTGGTEPEILIYDSEGRNIEIREKSIDVSKRDPLVQWYADHTSLEWFTTSKGEKRARVIVNGTPLFQNYGWSEFGYTSYFLTHNRKGVCGTYAWITAILFDLKGYPTRTMRTEFETPQPIYVDGKPVNAKGHVWAEIIIDGNIYVIDLGQVIPQEEYYQSHSDWKIMVNRLNNWPMDDKPN